MDVTTLIEPPSTVSALALEVAHRYLTPALLNHSIRSYAWAVDYGRRHQVPFDAELLYVSAMLHDCGLVPEFDSHTIPFEVASGHLAWVFGAAAGWAPERRSRASQTIVDHMRDNIDPAIYPEGHLLGVATSLDISGHDADDWTSAIRTSILDYLPRLDLKTEFLHCFEEQSRRKPESTAAAAMRAGIAHRIATNPLDG